jgi:hypothetical protein
MVPGMVGASLALFGVVVSRGVDPTFTLRRPLNAARSSYGITFNFLAFAVLITTGCSLAFSRSRPRRGGHAGTARP